MSALPRRAKVACVTTRLACVATPRGGLCDHLAGQADHLAGQGDYLAVQTQLADLQKQGLLLVLQVLPSTSVLGKYVTGNFPLAPLASGAGLGDRSLTGKSTHLWAATKSTPTAATGVRPADDHEDRGRRGPPGCARPTRCTTRRPDIIRRTETLMTDFPHAAADVDEHQGDSVASEVTRAAHLATTGVAGLLDPISRVERLQARRDMDRARWLGVDTFVRPPTPTELALIASVAGAEAAAGVRTRVHVRGGLYRRSWPTLVHPVRVA